MPVVRVEALPQVPVEILEQVETKVQPTQPVEETKAVIEAIEAAEPAEAVETVEVTQATKLMKRKLMRTPPAVSEGLAANLSAAGLQQVETKEPSAATGYVPVIQPGRAVAASAVVEDEGPARAGSHPPRARKARRLRTAGCGRPKSGGSGRQHRARASRAGGNHQA